MDRETHAESALWRVSVWLAGTLLGLGERLKAIWRSDNNVCLSSGSLSAAGRASVDKTEPWVEALAGGGAG